LDISKTFDNPSTVSQIFKCRPSLHNELTSLATRGGLLMHLDHANIVIADLDKAIGFFTDVLGFTKGYRPDFRVPGAWLYSQGRPLIHLTQATGGLPAAKMAPRVDHFALRVADLHEWNAVLERLNAHGFDYQVNAPDDGSDYQLWVPLAPGVIVEIIATVNQTQPRQTLPAPFPPVSR
jgi:catechol 2,3-dioxygenase-like lactoylglutathione lyase family enzyme